MRRALFCCTPCAKKKDEQPTLSIPTDPIISHTNQEGRRTTGREEEGISGCSSGTVYRRILLLSLGLLYFDQASVHSNAERSLGTSQERTPTSSS